MRVCLGRTFAPAGGRGAGRSAGVRAQNVGKMSDGQSLGPLWHDSDPLNLNFFRPDGTYPCFSRVFRPALARPAGQRNSGPCSPRRRAGGALFFGHLTPPRHGLLF